MRKTLGGILAASFTGIGALVGTEAFDESLYDSIMNGTSSDYVVTPGAPGPNPIISALGTEVGETVFTEYAPLALSAGTGVAAGYLTYKNISN